MNDSAVSAIHNGTVANNEDFFDQEENDMLFGGMGSGGTTPSTYLQTLQPTNTLAQKVGSGISKKLLANESVLSQMQGQFSIIKGYGDEDQAKLFSVTNPHKPKNQDFYVYTVNVSYSLK